MTTTGAAVDRRPPRRARRRDRRDAAAPRPNSASSSRTRWRAVTSTSASIRKKIAAAEIQIEAAHAHRRGLERARAFEEHDERQASIAEAERESDAADAAYASILEQREAALRELQRLDKAELVARIERDTRASAFFVDATRSRNSATRTPSSWRARTLTSNPQRPPASNATLRSPMGCDTHRRARPRSGPETSMK